MSTQYVFQKFIVDGVDYTANPLTLTMNGNKTVKAVYVLVQNPCQQYIDEIAQLQTQNTQLQAQITAKDATISSLNGKIAKANTDIDKVKADLA